MMQVREYGSISSEGAGWSGFNVARRKTLIEVRGRTELFSLSAAEAHVDNDAAFNLALQGKSSNAVLSGQASADAAMLSRVNMDETSAEALIASQKPQLRLASSTQSLYSGVHDSGDPLGSHTGHLGTADEFAGLSSFQTLNIADSMPDLASMQNQVADTQLDGLKDEFNTLANHRQQIINSLTLQRQSTAVKAAHDQTNADTLRLHRAVSKAAARNLRLALKAARLARQRAAEAKVVEQNELAIARIQRARADALESGRRDAMTVAAQAEASMHAQAQADRAYRSQQYHSAMRRYGSQLQQYVAKDMQLLGQLKAAEASAAVEPHLESSVWSQPPTPEEMPDVDPATFMGNAPFRDEDSLANFKQVKGSTQLSDTSAEDSIDRVMNREQAELQQLNTLDVKGSNAAEKAQGSMKLDISIADSLYPQSGVRGADGAAHLSTTAAELQSLKDIDSAASKLGDGELIRHPKEPIALVRIPLGGHEDALRKRTRGHVEAPKATIVDQSTEATAIRADGSHRHIVDESSFGRRIRHASNLQVKVHMPHVV